MSAASWLLAHSRADRGSASDWCMAWHEKHDSCRASSRASLKHGDSMRPLYSRPDTRIMPSGQNESLMNCGSLAISCVIAAELAACVGCTTIRVAVKSSPGRYGDPEAF